MHELVSDALFDHAAGDSSLRPKAPGSSGADLSFVRHLSRRLNHNLFIMNRLPLCLHNARFLDLLRPSCAGNPTLTLPQRTTHNPAGDADLSFVRHQRPPLTDKPRTMSSLSLLSEKR